MADGITRLVIAEALPLKGRGSYVHFHHRATVRASWTYCDVRAVIGRHEDAWLEQLDAWHGDYCRRAAAMSPLWWLLPGSRVTGWAPVDLKPLLFALGVIEVCTATRPSTLYVLECPDEVTEYLEEWTRQSGAGTVLTIGSGRVRPRRLTGRARRIVGALRAFASLLMRMARRGPVPVPTAPADVIVFSWALSALNLEQIGDHYFGRVFDDSNGPLGGRAAWLYALTHFSERQRIRRYCESIGRQVMFVVELVRWADIPGICRECVGLTWRLRRLARDDQPLTIGSLSTHRFVRRFWENVVDWQWPVDELAMRRAATRYMAAVGATSVIYPYEEKGTERSILAACGAQAPPARAIAFAHAAHNKGHRYLRRRHAAGRPKPDVIATTGPAAEAWLVSSVGLPASEVVNIGSPRFSIGAAGRSADSRRVLFLVGLGFEVGLLAQFVERLPNLFDGFDLTIRRNPHSWHDEQDHWLDQLRHLGLEFAVATGTLNRQIANADMVAFSSTSASIESMLQGRVTIHVGLHDVVGSDPFQGHISHPAVLSCTTPAALRETLSTVASLTPSQYASLAQDQRDFAETIYGPFDPASVVRAMLRSDAGDTRPLSDAAHPTESTPVFGR